MNRNLRFLIIVASSLIIGLFFMITPDIPLEELKKNYTNEASSFISLSGMDIHYRDEGAGPRIVLIHGTASSLHTWDAWTEELKKDYRVIRFDLPAFGLTGPHPDRDYRVAAYTEILDQLLKSLALDSVILAGNSLGGRIAWQYAAEHPQMVSKLVLIDASGFPTEKGLPWIFGLARVPVLNRLISKITPRSIIEKNVKEVYFDDTKVSEKLIDRYYHFALREGNRQAFIDRAQLDLKGDINILRKIKIPTLIIWGRNDEWIPVEHLEKFKSAIPNAKAFIIENSGHVPMEENPVETLEILTTQFLNE
jgi:pimeloyl-ACP methyl ester carboxylesterase